MRDLANLFKALADETRLEMLALLLSRDELCVCDFVGALGITQSKASRHLRYLLNAGLLADRPDGVWVHYRVAPALGPQREIVVEAVRRLLAGQATRDLQRRAEAWLARKAALGVACEPADGTAPAISLEASRYERA